MQSAVSEAKGNTSRIIMQTTILYFTAKSQNKEKVVEALNYCLVNKGSSKHKAIKDHNDVNVNLLLQNTIY